MPLPPIATDRLSLRPFTQDDVDVLHAVWTDPDVRRYLWDDIVIPRERAVDVVRSHLESVAASGIGYWVVHTAEDKPVIGFCGFRFIEGGNEIELMYGLLPQYWRRGLATEASRAALDYLWRNTSFVRAWARTDPPNTKSVEVMRRLHMRHVSSTATIISYVIERPAHA
jgi:[ribosomal protein S5]-alanine N-acetyltransferase